MIQRKGIFKIFILIFVFSYEIVISLQQDPKTKNTENVPSKWYTEAQASLVAKLHAMPVHKLQAKNVIIFLGDGMSISTVTASRIHLEQRSNKTGEHYKLEMDNFPYAGLSKTYCADALVADSACSATAYLCGVKGNLKTIGVTENVKLYDCKGAADKQNQVSSIAEWAQKSGKATGIVTTTRVTHASPAGNYAHIANRGMESDFDIHMANGTQNPEYCRDIAQQLVYDQPGKYFNVIMGGGRMSFLPSSNSSSESKEFGNRLDGQDLISEWLKDKKSKKAKYVRNRNELLNANIAETDYLLGLFSDSHMSYNLDNIDKEEPPLAEMTKSAIKVLQKNKNGFYLFVEGGHIDLAHHKTYARKALDETIEFSKAITVAKEMTSRLDTLIVVTADHSHTMTISGYTTIKTDILGLSEKKSDGDGLPFTTLSYANGIDTKRLSNGTRKNLTNDDFTNVNYTYPSNVPMYMETHGGEDVAVYASGPWSHLFSGVYEQNLIPELMAFAACIGEGITSCNNCC